MQLASEHRYDVSLRLCRCAWPVPSVTCCVSMHGLLYVLSLQGPMCRGSRPDTTTLPVLTPFITQIWRRAGVATTISAEQGGVGASHDAGSALVTIPSRVDTNAFVPPRNSGRPFTHDLFIVAQLIERKGNIICYRPSPILRAANHEPMALIFVGTRDAEPQLRELAAKLHTVAEAVTFRALCRARTCLLVYHTTPMCSCCLLSMKACRSPS